jgi:O-antigen/teichoic acid export membrane protein
MELIPDEPLQQKLIRNWFRLYFFQFLVAPAGYLIKMMISRELSVEDIGLFYSIMGLITIISAYNDLWLTEALQYYLPHYFIDKEYSKAKTIIVFTWLMQFISGVLISGFLYFWSNRLAIHYFQTSHAWLLLKYFALYFIILNLFQVISSLFVAVQNVKRQQWVDAIRMRSVVILTFVSIYRWILDTLTFTKRRLVGVCIALLWSRWGLKRSFRWLFRDYPLIWDRQLIKQQWIYWFWILIGVGAGTLLGQINQQFALYFFWTEAAGYWTNYLSFYTIINVIIWPIITYLFPLLNELYKKGEKEKIKLLYRYLFIGIFIFGTIGWIGWRFLSESAAVLFFWENFRQSGILFHYYSPFIITLPLIWVLFQDIASRGMVRQRVYAIIYALIINIIASMILGKYFGLIGLVYGQLAGNIVLLWCSWYRWKKK